MEAKVGDRVSIDAKKVGQPRRVGVIEGVTTGISGVRYTVRWAEGHQTVLSPGAGNLTVERRSGAKKSSNGSKKKAGAKKTTKRKR
ncbi:MAG: DUF1918 domain-containing protein [Actinomycetota bacterium]